MVGEVKSVTADWQIIKEEAFGEDIGLKIEGFFDKDTMSVHLKEDVIPTAKVGKPGEWTLKQVSTNKLSSEEIQNIAQQIIEIAKKRNDCFIEIQREGSIIAQLGVYRVVISNPPLSDGWEITAVRPTKFLNLDDYNLSEKLAHRIKSQAEGILISGAPGEGKTTFVQALATHYAQQNRIVKTIEAPRDLRLPKSVTQYAISRAQEQELRDILLLSRPDHTLFDEMRNTDDFRLFSDLRLSGVGMVGVVHAANPVDAIQRFIGRIELGVIPHVIDTVVFIKSGQIDSVYEVKMEIKVPFGMTEKDLARPVVVVKDFETKKAVYEIYSYGEDTVVVPIKEKAASNSSLNKIVEDKVKEHLKKYSDNIKAEVLDENTVKAIVLEKDVARIIGKNRHNLEKIEDEIGVKLVIEGIEAKCEKQENKPKNVSFEVELSEKSIQIKIGQRYNDKLLDVYIHDEFIISAKVGKNGNIKVKKESDVGKEILEGVKKGSLKVLE